MMYFLGILIALTICAVALYIISHFEDITIKHILLSVVFSITSWVGLVIAFGVILIVSVIFLFEEGGSIVIFPKRG